MGSSAIFTILLPLASMTIAATPALAQDESPASTPVAPRSAIADYLDQARSYQALLARYGAGIETWNQLVSASPPGYRVDYLAPYW